MNEVVGFKEGYGRYIPSGTTLTSDFIKMKSGSSSNKLYLVRIMPPECSCPSFHYNQSKNKFICKHMKKLLTVPIPVNEMLKVLKYIDGDVEIFLRNYSYTKLLILMFRQHIVWSDSIKKNKVIVLE